MRHIIDNYKVFYRDKQIGYYRTFSDGTLEYRTAWGCPWDIENELKELGLDKEITDKAKAILTSQKDPSILVVEKLQETQQQLSKNLEEAESIKEDSLSIKKEYEENLSNIKKDKKNAPIFDIKFIFLLSSL